MATQSSAQQWAQRLDQALLTASQQARCIDQQDAPHSTVVWFSDTVVMLTRVIQKSLRREAFDAWYWQNYFPSQPTTYDLAERLLQLSRHIQRDQPLLVLFSSVIEQQLKQGDHTTVMHMMTTQLAHEILIDSGFSLHAVAAHPAHRPFKRGLKLDVGWQQLIENALQAWGEQDVRSHCLVLNGLLSKNPALLADASGLWQRAQQLLQALQSNVAASVSTESLAEHSAQPTSSAQADAAASESRERSLDSLQHPFSEARPSRQSVARKSARADGLAPRQVATLSPAETASPPCPAIRPIVQPAIDEASSNRSHSQPWLQNLVSEPQAGLLLVIPLLLRLQIDACLQDNPALAEANLPSRVLHDLLHRFDILPAHPLRYCLPEIASIIDHRINRFVSPALWRDLAAPRSHDSPTLYLHPLESLLPRCLISDRSCRLILFVGTQTEANEWAQGTRLIMRKECRPVPQLRAIELTLQRLMARYLQRMSAISLRTLIERPGLIAVTRTHIDLQFSLSQMEFNIRRGGLDIDPGWVGWLGRVMQIHYHAGDDNV